MFIGLLNETNWISTVICFFFILQGGESKTKEHPGNEVEVN